MLPLTIRTLPIFYCAADGNGCPLHVKAVQVFTPGFPEHSRRDLCVRVRGPRLRYEGHRPNVVGAVVGAADARRGGAIEEKRV